RGDQHRPQLKKAEANPRRAFSREANRELDLDGLFEDPLTAPPLDRTSMLLDLGRALSLARSGPGETLLQAVQDQAPVMPPATELTEQLDSILKILLSWEDFNSAINLLRSLLERQRGLYLRTREASER
ncbi:MAG: hypothetical protein ACPGQD_03585, partial [Planctomycetota bacterium]